MGADVLCKDPGKGSVCGQVAELGVKETKEAIEHAHAAFLKWNKTTGKERSDKLLKLFQLCTEHAEDLAKLVTLENGKALVDAKGEITYGTSFFDWYAGEAVRFVCAPKSSDDLKFYSETMAMWYAGIEHGHCPFDGVSKIPANAPGMRNIVIKQGIGVCGIVRFLLAPRRLLDFAPDHPLEVSLDSPAYHHTKPETASRTL
jgi:succinate-semialdehyde dehydrogenase/glutarate-semialdehyde dehydrogenase